MKKAARLLAIVAGIFTVAAGAQQGEKILKGKMSVAHKDFKSANRMPQDVASQ